MGGFIYIAGSFVEIALPMPTSTAWRDNDPHFWSNPPTWGICRPDLRDKANPGDYIFFVLPKECRFPQMIFGYMKIDRIVSHLDAHNDAALVGKQMSNRNPNGNIIVTATGAYNKYDGGVHRKGFPKIQQRYAVGDPINSKFLDEVKVRSLAPQFLAEIQRIFKSSGTSPFQVISRYGRSLDAGQIQALITFLK
jgi:hypothetical protein